MSWTSYKIFSSHVQDSAISFECCWWVHQGYWWTMERLCIETRATAKKIRVQPKRNRLVLWNAVRRVYKKEISWQNYRKADFEFSHWTHGICLSEGSTSWQLSTCISGCSTNMIGVVVDVEFIHKCEINLRDNLWMFILSRGMKESYQDPPDSSRHAMIAIRTERVAGYSGICIPWVRRRTTHPLQVCKGFSTDRVDETVRPRKSTFPNLHHIFRRELRNPSPAVKYNVGSAGLLFEWILINKHAFNCYFSWTWTMFVYCSWYCDFICNLISETN